MEKNLNKNCKFYKMNIIGGLKFYCSNTSKELRRIKEQKGLVKRIENGLDYRVCIGFNECSFKEILIEDNKL